MTFSSHFRPFAPARLVFVCTTALLMAGCSATLKPNNSALLLNQAKQISVAATPRLKPSGPTVASYAQTAVAPANASLAPADDPVLNDTDGEIPDPNEKLNRKFNAFNTGFDRALVRPLSKVYGVIVPPPARYVIRNGLRHLETPGDFVNYLLQGNPDQAGQTLTRFIVNSTVGLGGAIDVARYIDAPYNPTDFGLTLAKWGVKEGRYLVLPVLGPSTRRDGLGRIVDTALQPQTYLGLIFDFAYGGLISRSVEIVDRRHRNGDLLDNVIFASPDPYVTLRSTYVQRRRARASGNVIGAEGMTDALPVIATAGN